MVNEKESASAEPGKTTHVDPIREGRSNKRQRGPPPSMWTAPQSLIPPPNPANIASERLREKYFRRVTVPDNVNGPLPTKWQRGANIAGGVLSAALAVYMVLFHEFGRDGEHVFSPIRRMVKVDQLNPLALSAEEKKKLAQSRSVEDDKRRAKILDDAKMV
ncbi:hypothetical protein CBS101457_001770 [Exobasidium rhododendri]|nr:hypothetical protein CBS101457_001770 [Exobasidium rhododendri]